MDKHWIDVYKCVLKQGRKVYHESREIGGKMWGQVYIDSKMVAFGFTYIYDIEDTK